MRKTLGISLVVLLLTCSVNAGIMANESPAPPSQPAPAVQGPTTDGEMDTGLTAPNTEGDMQNDAAATFIQVVLNLLALS
jgi:hypothetical protein